mmetsp:Transcript_11778/g.19178  ORF Transcript_11778/g.19178 Transcript_11778/m.19178 type:complete len:438 (-) Transcript_11778:100-1413(-)
MDTSTSSHYMDLGDYEDSGQKEQVKLEFHSEYDTSPALSFLSFTIRRPSIAKWNIFAAYLILRVCFLLYGLFFLVFGIIEFIYRFDELFWLLHATMLVKMVVLRVALLNIKERLEWQSSLEYLRLMDESVPYGKSYFVITSICNMIVMAFYYSVWADDFGVGMTNVGLMAVFILGTLAYTLFTVSVLIVSITDAKKSSLSVAALIKIAERGLITSDEYSATFDEIRDTVKKGYYLNGTLLLSMLSNTVAAIVLLLKFRVITDGEDTLHIVSFTVYVLVVQWATDVVFLYILLPEIALVNDLAHALHVTTTNQRWVEGRTASRAVDTPAASRNTLENIANSIIDGKLGCSLGGDGDGSGVGRAGGDSAFMSGLTPLPPLHVMEADRHDTLHRIIAQPIRYTIASIHFTRKGARNQLFGVVMAVMFSFMRVMVSLMLDK